MKTMRKLLFFLLFLPFLQGCIGCFIPALRKRNVGFFKLPESQRGPTDLIKPGIYYRMIRDTDGEICNYDLMYIFDDHSTYGNISFGQECPPIRYGDMRMYNHPINGDTTISREVKILALIDSMASEFHMYEEDYMSEGNWRLIGDTLEVREFGRRSGTCIDRVYSMKYLILNDSTIQALSLSNTKVDTDKANKVTIAHHREFPKLINPPKNNRKYWD